MFEEIIYYGTLVTVRAGFKGKSFNGIVLHSLSAEQGFSNSFLDATMYRVAEIGPISETGGCAIEVKAMHQWVPCELMENHDDTRSEWAQTILREYFGREPKL
jgi:hypothetical protein